MARTMKQGATWPPLRMLIEDENGPVDLTNADTVELEAKATVNGTTVTLTGAMTPDADQSTAPPAPFDDTARATWLTGRGWAAFDFAVGDTDQPGEYAVLSKVTWDSVAGDIEFFPSTGSDTLTIEAV